MKTFTLSTGDKIPAIGLGTWQSELSLVAHAVKMALELGYQHIDCAAVYLNEAAVGSALTEAIQSNVITRENLWVTSKPWNSYHQAEHVEGALKQTLKDLQLDYLDLYLIHWPIAFKSRVGFGFPESGDDFLPANMVPLTETYYLPD